MLRGLNWILLVAGLALVAISIVSETDTGIGVFLIPAVGFFVAFAYVPYVAFGVLNRRLTRTLPLAICTVGLLGLSAFWVWGFGGAFWWNKNPDAQDALILVVLPAYMIAATGALALGAWGLERYLTSRRS